MLYESFSGLREGLRLGLRASELIRTSQKCGLVGPRSSPETSAPKLIQFKMSHKNKKEEERCWHKITDNLYEYVGISSLDTAICNSNFNEYTVTYRCGYCSGTTFYLFIFFDSFKKTDRFVVAIPNERNNRKPSTNPAQGVWI